MRSSVRKLFNNYLSWRQYADDLVDVTGGSLLIYYKDATHCLCMWVVYTCVEFQAIPTVVIEHLYGGRSCIYSFE